LIIVKIIIFITQIIIFLILRIFKTQTIIIFYIKTLNYYKNNNIITQIIISFIWICWIIRKIIIFRTKIIIFFIWILCIIKKIFTTQIIIFFILILRIVEYF
jgi:hypothetical protein